MSGKRRESNGWRKKKQSASERKQPPLQPPLSLRLLRRPWGASACQMGLWLLLRPSLPGAEWLRPHLRGPLPPHRPQTRSQLLPRTRSQLLPQTRSQLLPQIRSQLLPQLQSQLKSQPQLSPRLHRGD